MIDFHIFSEYCRYRKFFVIKRDWVGINVQKHKCKYDKHDIVTHIGEYWRYHKCCEKECPVFKEAEDESQVDKS